MNKRVLSFLLVMLLLVSALFAESKINNYVSIGSGFDIGWDEKGDSDYSGDTVKTTYIPIRIDGANYFNPYVGIGYGVGINFPIALSVGDTKYDEPLDFIPIDIVLRTSLNGRYPVTSMISMGGKFGTDLSFGFLEVSEETPAFSRFHADKIFDIRVDITLGAFCELALTEKLGLVTGMDVSFPVYKRREYTETSLGTSTTKDGKIDYARYAIKPYVGFTFIY